MQNTTPRTALRLPAVIAKTGLSKTHIYRLMKAGAFPLSYALSERVRVWDQTQVDDFLSGRLADGTRRPGRQQGGC